MGFSVKDLPLAQADGGEEDIPARYAGLLAPGWVGRLVQAVEVLGGINAAARKAAVSRVTVQNYCAGRIRKPDLTVLERVSAAAGRPPRWVAVGEDQPKVESKDAPRSDIRPQRAPPGPTEVAEAGVQPGAAGKEEQPGQGVSSRGGAALPVVGLAECGLRGWSRQEKLWMMMDRPTDLADPDAYVVIAVGTSLMPRGIFPGNLVTISPAAPLGINDVVHVTRRDGTVSLKVYLGEDHAWVYLRGWLDPDGGRQEPYTDRVAVSAIQAIHPAWSVRWKF